MQWLPAVPGRTPAVGAEQPPREETHGRERAAACPAASPVSTCFPPRCRHLSSCSGSRCRDSPGSAVQPSQETSCTTSIQFLSGRNGPTSRPLCNPGPRSWQAPETTLTGGRALQDCYLLGTSRPSWVVKEWSFGWHSRQEGWTSFSLINAVFLSTFHLQVSFFSCSDADTHFVERQ